MAFPFCKYDVTIYDRLGTSALLNEKKFPWNEYLDNTFNRNNQFNDNQLGQQKNDILISRHVFKSPYQNNVHLEWSSVSVLHGVYQCILQIVEINANIADDNTRLWALLGTYCDSTFSWHVNEAHSMSHSRLKRHILCIMVNKTVIHCSIRIHHMTIHLLSEIRKSKCIIYRYLQNDNIGFSVCYHVY